jgi:hypothetical protein
MNCWRGIFPRVSLVVKKKMLDILVKYIVRVRLLTYSHIFLGGSK